jgi:hypothetical protein
MSHLSIGGRDTDDRRRFPGDSPEETRNPRAISSDGPSPDHLRMRHAWTPGRGHAKARACSWPLSLFGGRRNGRPGSWPGVAIATPMEPGMAERQRCRPQRPRPAHLSPVSHARNSRHPPRRGGPSRHRQLQIPARSRRRSRLGPPSTGPNRDSVARDIYFAAGNVHSRVLNKNDGISRTIVDRASAFDGRSLRITTASTNGPRTTSDRKRERAFPRRF